MALACGLGLAAVALALGLARPAARADDPPPWESYGGPDGYYIARGWTDGYSSQPMRLPAPSTAPAASLAHRYYLPLVGGGAPSENRETRALWVTRWDFKTVDDVQAIVDKAAYAHFTTILFQVRGQADALYNSHLEPWSAVTSGTLGQNPGWDPLAEMVARAHAQGLEVQAWINVYPAWLGTTPPSASAVPLPMYHDFDNRYGNDWVQWDYISPMVLNSSYLCGSPGHPAVVDRIVAVCQDILANYAVDGLHFDYIRYAGAQYSYDSESEEAYLAALESEPSLSRAEWQRRQVTAFIQRVRQEALPLRPGARLTTSAWPIYVSHWDWFPYPGGYDAYYQDSQGWARSGLVSGIMPMLYSQSVHDYRDRFQQLSQDFVSGSQPGGVFIGIEGDYASFDEISWRISTARAAGARGQALFSYRLFDEGNWWQALRDGPYKERAVPNWP